MDDTTSQWVYYRFAGHTTVFEIEIEDIYRYGWAAMDSAWSGGYFMNGISLTNRNNIQAFAHHDNTTVIATDINGVETTASLNKYELTPNGFVANAVSVRSNNPIQMYAPSNTVHNERYFIQRALRSTRFIYHPSYYNNTHDMHIYVHQDNTTIQITTEIDHQNGLAPMTVLRNKGTYMMRFGNSTNMAAGSYDSYHTFKSASDLGGHVITSDKPINVSFCTANAHFVQVSPPTQTLGLTIRYNSCGLNWWCFDDPTKYENESIEFSSLDKSGVFRTLTVPKYTRTTNWSTSGSTWGSIVTLATGAPNDVYFYLSSGGDGNGRDAASFISLEYASTEYAQLLHTGSSDKDPMFYTSFDTGLQGVKKITLDATTRAETGETLTTADFTAAVGTDCKAGVKYYANAIVANPNIIFRTTSANTYISSYTNINDKEGWKYGNIPNAHALLFTPL
jgi:hypothetical protein